jgi:hypothetical protein
VQRLGQQQPKSEAYGKYLVMKKAKKDRLAAEKLSRSVAENAEVLDLFDHAG